MLRISKLADYATVVMVYLARHVDDVSNAREIAEHIHLSVPTVSKLLKLLVNANLLTSMRGAYGGYRLSLSTDDISVADIIKAVEGDAGLTECSLSDNQCSLQAVCSIQGNWQLISQAVKSALKSVSLADFASETLSAKQIDISQLMQLHSAEEVSEASA